MREITDQNNSKYGHFLRSLRFTLSLSESTFFSVVSKIHIFLKKFRVKNIEAEVHLKASRKSTMELFSENS